MRIRLNHPLWISMVCALIPLLAALSGCQRSTPPGPDLVSSTIEDTSYTFLHWKEGLRVMIWTDITENVGSDGSGSSSDPIHRQQGYASAPDGRRVDWHLETADGKTATFSLNNRGYDLSEGALFLVTTRGREIQVRQVNHDLASIRPTVESCEDFARTDPEVKRFIEAASHLE